MTDNTVSIAELPSWIGRRAGPGPWFTVTQEQIDAFAGSTHDHQYIHVDPELASQTQFGSTIAHGMLTLSLLPHFSDGIAPRIEGVYMGINYGFDRVRFLEPVKVGSRIRAALTVIDVAERNPGEYLVKSSVEVELENAAKPALVAEWLTLQLVGQTDGG